LEIYLNILLEQMFTKAINLKLDKDLIWGLIFAILTTLGIVRLQIDNINQKRSNLTKPEYLAQQQAQEVQVKLINKFPTLGFDNLIANGVFLDFIQYTGDTPAREATGYSLLPDYFRALVKKDPRFVEAYLYLDPATTLLAGQPQVSVDLMLEGLQYIQPQQKFAPQIWFFKGINELLFLEEPPEAINSFKMAAQWGKEQNTPQSLLLAKRAEETIAFLETNPDSKAVRANAWLTILLNSRDKKVQEIAFQEIKKLGATLEFKPGEVRIKFLKDN
jgi:hypothetical protein